MLEYNSLKFEKGAILTKEMLQEMYAYPHDFIKIRYDDYADGIILGMLLKKVEESIYLTKGVVKFKGDIYLMKSDLNLSEYILDNSERLDSQTYYKMAFNIDVKNPQYSIVSNTMEFGIYESEDSITGFTLCKFKLDANKQLDIDNLKDYENMAKPTFLNLVNCPYSANDVTFHPHIFELISRKLVTKKNKVPFDYVILEQIYMNKVISRKTIMLYIQEAGFEDTIDYDNENLLKVFLKSIEKYEWDLYKQPETAQLKKENKIQEKGHMLD